LWIVSDAWRQRHDVQDTTRPAGLPVAQNEISRDIPAFPAMSSGSGS
jgi:hypothetical protein